MGALIDIIRWYIRACPVESRKAALGRWAARRLDRDCGPRFHGGIGGVAKMELDLAQEYDRAVYLNLIDRMAIKVLCRVLRPGDTFVDAGANIGLFTVIASHLVGDTGAVHAFEPQPSVAERLRRNVEANGARNVTIHKAGLWHQPGELELRLFEGLGTCTGTVGAPTDRAVRQVLRVPVERLDDIVKPPVRLIKMDVEGADWNALKGAETILSSDPAPHLILEVNDSATRAVGYSAMEMVDGLLECVPCRMMLLERKRMHAITRDALAHLVGDTPGGYFNVWFEPLGDH